MSAKPKIDRLTKVLLIEWRSLPKAGGIYLAIDGAERVWYVADIQGRFQYRDRLLQFQDNGVTHIKWKECESAVSLLDLLKIEIYAIIRFENLNLEM